MVGLWMFHGTSKTMRREGAGKFLRCDQPNDGLIVVAKGGVSAHPNDEINAQQNAGVSS